MEELNGKLFLVVYKDDLRTRSKKLILNKTESELMIFLNPNNYKIEIIPKKAIVRMEELK